MNFIKIDDIFSSSSDSDSSDDEGGKAIVHRYRKFIEEVMNEGI